MQTTLDITQLEKKILGTIDIDKGPTFKAILLVRDPRAVSNSRENLNLCNWNNNQTCVEVPKLCNRLDTDVDTGNKNLNYTVFDYQALRIPGLGDFQASVKNFQLAVIKPVTACNCCLCRVSHSEMVETEWL